MFDQWDNAAMVTGVQRYVPEGVLRSGVVERSDLQRLYPITSEAEA